MSHLNPNEQAATTTSVSNREYTTYLPLRIIEDKGGEDDPGAFANPFADEVEAASISGFFNGDIANSISSSYNSFLTSPDNMKLQQSAQQRQQLLHTTQQDRGPALPLHFQASDSTPDLTQFNASSFVIGEIPTVSSTISVARDKNITSSVPQAQGQGQFQFPTRAQFIQTSSQITPHQAAKQAGAFHTQHPLSASGYHHQFAPQSQSQHLTGSNLPSTISTTTINSLNPTPTYSAVTATPQVTSTGSVKSTTSKGSKRKSATPGSSKNLPQISEDETEEIKRRRKHERNLREQQRSQRITEQIAELRKVLVDTANIKFNKTDKYSILCKAVDHIRELQTQCVNLDTEHQKLVETISQTSEIVHSNSGLGATLHKDSSSSSTYPGGDSSSSEVALCGSSSVHSSDAASSSNDNYIPEASTSTFFNTMALFDYKTIFGQCCAALAVFGLDGLLLDCNQAFEVLTGSNNMSANAHSENSEDKGEMSLFRLVKNPKDVNEICSAMEMMIKEKINEPRFWSGTVCSMREPSQTLIMNLTLTRNQEGNPRFFNCAVFNVS